MLFQKISSAFLSVTVMLSSLTINGMAAVTEKETSPSQEISCSTDNGSNEYAPDIEADTVELTGDSESSVSVGGFTVTGGVLDTDFSYSGKVLTVLTAVPLTISNTSASDTTDTIAVAEGVSANVTLSGVYIDVSSTSCAAAFEVSGTGDVNIIIEGNNTLESGTYCAGIHKSGTGTLTIGGTGTLTAIGGEYAAGIGNGRNISPANITINGGTIIATGQTVPQVSAADMAKVLQISQ